MRTLLTTCASLVISSSVIAADAPSPELAFSFKPVHSRVEYETPAKADYDKCQVKVERSKKKSGWVVYGPAGQVLRRYIDTNSDNVVDQWRYYQHGLEVYRDVDSNFNNKVDNSRWLNSGGSRWGLDKDEDGRIDEWKIISAQEASREAFEAMKSRDERALKVLCINSGDLKKLGINDSLTKDILASVESPGVQLRKILGSSKILTRESKWTRFDSSTPSIIPADDEKATEDLMVYENAMAIIEADNKPGLLQIGELVRIGEAWKLTQIPQPLEGNSVEVTLGGILMQPALALSESQSPVENIPPEMQKLLKDLQKLDENSPQPTDGVKALTRYNAQRADLLEKLISVSKTEADREQWMRQMVDGIAASVQAGSYPEGVARLKRVESGIKKNSPKSALVSYVVYRRLLSQYTVDLQKAKAEEREKMQEKWLKELEDFAKDYPEADDTPDALLQLAIAEEFSGRMKQARKWYAQLTKKHQDSPAGTRATGALRRLDLEGKSFVFAATGLKGDTISSDKYRGKVLLVKFWSTWCKPCTEDLPQLRAIYDQHHESGFEILGVNLDVTLEEVDGYLKQHKVSWAHVHEPGGLESIPAVDYGIISLPTMFLVDANGKVVSRSTSVDDLKKQLPELLNKK